MKKSGTLIVLVILAVVAAACSGANAPALTLGAAPWQDGEKAVYDIVDTNGSKLGTSEFSFARDGDAWLLTTTTKTGQVEEAAKVRLDGATLRPLGKEKTIKNAGTDATLSITYSTGKVQMKAVVNGKEQNVAVGIPANVLENDQLLMTLRAIPFAAGYQGSLVTFVPESAAKVKTTVRVLGQEKVETPAGSVDAWRVEGNLGQAKHSAWYAVAAPYALVQYDNGATKMVLSK
jgi:hypothetical protein